MDNLIIALALITVLNIFYTVWSFHLINKWKNQYMYHHNSGVKEVRELSNLKPKIVLNEKLIDDNSEIIENLSKRNDIAHSKIVETMMSLETRLYGVEQSVYVPRLKNKDWVEPK